MDIQTLYVMISEGATFEEVLQEYGGQRISIPSIRTFKLREAKRAIFNDYQAGMTIRECLDKYRNLEISEAFIRAIIKKKLEDRRKNV